MSREFTVGAHSYQSLPLDAFSQLHIGTKLAPHFAKALASGGSRLSTLSVLADVPREDIDFVVKTALGVVRRKDGKAWAQVYNAKADQLAYQDITGLELLEIVSETVKEYLDPFFVGLLRMVSGEENETSASSSTKTTTS